MQVGSDYRQQQRQGAAHPVAPSNSNLKRIVIKPFMKPNYRVTHQNKEKTHAAVVRRCVGFWKFLNLILSYC